MDTSHVSALAAKHAACDRRLSEERLRPLPDSGVLSSLKKQKLRLKEEMKGL